MLLDPHHVAGSSLEKRDLVERLKGEQPPIDQRKLPVEGLDVCQSIYRLVAGRGGRIEDADGCLADPYETLGAPAAQRSSSCDDRGDVLPLPAD